MTPEHAEVEIQSIIRRVAERHGASVTFEYEWHEGVTKVRVNYNLSARRGRLLGLMFVSLNILAVAQCMVVLFLAWVGSRGGLVVWVAPAGCAFLLVVGFFSRRICPPASLDAITAEYRAEIARKIPGHIEFT